MTNQMRIYVIERAIVDKIEYLPGQVLDLPVHAARRLLADSGAFTTEAPALPTPITISNWPEGWTQADVERLQALLAERKLPPDMLFPFAPDQAGTPLPPVTPAQATLITTGDQGGEQGSDQSGDDNQPEDESTEEGEKPTDEGKAVDGPPSDKMVRSGKNKTK